MKKAKFYAIAMAAALTLLAGCNDSTSTPARAPQSQTATQAFPEIATKASGFSVGNQLSARVAYVFFDPQCPHCAVLWKAAAPVVSANEARFVWIPIGMLNRASAPQGATILGAADPSKAMNENEALLTARRGGITANDEAVDKFKDKVESNTELFNSFRATGDGVPLVVTKVNGVVRTQSGSMPTAMLRSFMGIPN